MAKRKLLYRNLPEEEKEAKREYEKNRYRNMTKDKKNAKKMLKKIIFLYNIKMSEKKLKFCDVEVN